MDEVPYCSRQSDHIAALRHMLGDAAVLVGSDVANYETGARDDKGRAAFVVTPASTQEVSASVSYCVKNGIAIVP